MSLMGMIRVARTQLGTDEEAYRTLLFDTLGKRSLAGSTAKEQWRVIEELKTRGFQPRPFHKGKELVDDPQAKKIRALWLTMADCGIIRDRSEKALSNYVRRFTGRTLKDATVKQLQAVIEILKQHFNRCDDPRKRAICLAALKDEGAPPVLDGKPVAGGAHGGVYQ